MNDLISREVAIAEVHKNYDAILDFKSNGRTVADSFEDIINSLPSVQPEIIRCQECKHWDKTWTNDWSPDYHYCSMIEGVRKGDFYCADAERRTE